MKKLYNRCTISGKINGQNIKFNSNRTKTFIIEEINKCNKVNDKEITKECFSKTDKKENYTPLILFILIAILIIDNLFNKN